MANLKRKLKRKKLNEIRKRTKKQLKNVEKSLNNMPQSCGRCDKPFDTSESEKWMIRVGMNGAVLTCPECREELYESQDKEAES